MRGHMTTSHTRWTLVFAAVALFVAPQFPLAAEAAQAANQAQAEVSPTLKKAARIQKMNSQMRITHAQRVEAAKNLKATRERLAAAKAEARAKGIAVPETGLRAVPAVKRGNALRAGAAPQQRHRAPPGRACPRPARHARLLHHRELGLQPPAAEVRGHAAASRPPGAPSTLDGHFIPVAYPDTTTYPGSDYYEISVREYNHRFHSDLPAPGTTVRGYVQTNNGTDPATGLNTVAPEGINWLGPVIVAVQDRPVRIKFKNELPVGAGGDLNIPVDETIMGSGKGALFANGATCDPTPPGVNLHGQDCAPYPQNRAAIHLHGGRTPWISDGTPHQWILPAGEIPNTPYKQGVSLFNVPDMPAPAAGETTYYWTNQQSARLMFYHDHAWGITRLNVMVGEAAGIVLTDADRAGAHHPGRPP